jgi:orotate phosphoribosyltransferase
MSDLKATLAKAFIATESFKSDLTTGFKLSSGEVSNYYVDCKNLMSSPEYRRLVAQLAFEQIKGLKFDCIGGLEIGAIAIATAISDFAYSSDERCDWRTFVVRKIAKEHGLTKLIEGNVKKGERVLIVDDVLTTGQSILKAVQASRDAGFTVQNALVIVDRQEQNGRQNIEGKGINLISILSIKDLQKIVEPVLR